LKAEDINTATNSNPLPLYIQLSDQLRKKIVNHEIKKGEKIPSEMQLHESTGMSRSTVRKAIEILVEENLLIKVHGKGTFVSNEKIIEDKNSQFLSFTENARRLGKKLITKTVNSQLVIPTKEQSNFFDIDSTEKIIEIIRLRYMDNIPICVETSWFTNSFEFLMNEDLDGSLYELLINKYDVMPAKGKKNL
jgi:GntR family transcriptional regulator